ncbi:MAG: hypothetical protein IT424_10840 [Pirellulales bacterium]|nr:hypothetical protein [Pirellulales bacterium]
MAKDGPISMSVRQHGRRGALIAPLMATMMSCGGGTQEAPFVAARPIPSASAKVHCVVCAQFEEVSSLVPLPPVESSIDDETDLRLRLLPPVELPLDDLRELSDDAGQPQASPGLVIAPAPDAATAKRSPPPGDDRQSVALASPLPISENASTPALPAQTGANLASSPPEADAQATGGGYVQRPEPDLLAQEPHSAEARQLLAEASAASTGAPTEAIVAERAQAKIRRGYALAQRSANFAARSEFLEVLHMIAEANDQQDSVRRRTHALASGLRALDEAADFAHHGAVPDDDAAIAVIISSHRTPVAKSPGGEKMLPRQLADIYFRYAQVQLGASVAGDAAGSMALHALGKLYSQLGRMEPDRCPLADRRAFALQQASLLARPDNHLAAHELGVLLAESGHFDESEFLLAQVATRQPHPIVLRNLARVQRKLGREQAAQLSDRRAEQLASQNAAPDGPVVWVPPGTLAQSGNGPYPVSSAAMAGSLPGPQTSSENLAGRPQSPPPMPNVTRRPGGYMR